jgi:hypothetical protein
VKISRTTPPPGQELEPQFNPTQTSQTPIFISAINLQPANKLTSRDVQKSLYGEDLMENMDDYVDESEYMMEISGSKPDLDGYFSDVISDFEESQENTKTRTAVPFKEVQTFDFVPSVHKKQNPEEEVSFHTNHNTHSKYKQPIQKLKLHVKKVTHPVSEDSEDDFENTDSIVTTPIIHEEARKRYPGNPMATTNKNQERIKKMYSDKDLRRFLRSKIPISSGQSTLQSEGPGTSDDSDSERENKLLSSMTKTKPKPNKPTFPYKKAFRETIRKATSAWSAFKTGILNINSKDLKKSINNQILYMNLIFMILTFFLIGRVSSFSNNFQTFLLIVFSFFSIFLIHQIAKNYVKIQKARKTRKRSLGVFLPRPKKPPDPVKSQRSLIKDDISSIIPEVPTKGIKDLTPPGSVGRRMKSRKFKIEQIRISDASVDLIDNQPQIQITLPNNIP